MKGMDSFSHRLSSITGIRYVYSPPISLSLPKTYSHNLPDVTMNNTPDEVKKEKEKYLELIRRGKSVSDLRAIKEEKENRIENIDSDIKIKKAFKSGSKGENRKYENEVDRMFEKKDKIKKEVLAIREIIIEKDKSDIGSGTESDIPILSEEYNPLKQISAYEAKDYGVDTKNLERKLKIERWLDSNYPGWFKESIPSSAKRKLVDHFDVGSSMIDKNLGDLRDMRRRDKIKKWIEDNFPKWVEEDVPDQAKNVLTDLLNITDDKLNQYLENLRWEKKNE